MRYCVYVPLLTFVYQGHFLHWVSEGPDIILAGYNGEEDDVCLCVLDKSVEDTTEEKDEGVTVEVDYRWFNFGPVCTRNMVVEEVPVQGHKFYSRYFPEW